MVASEAAHERPPRRWPLSEKRRIVELTLREGASVSAIARAHGVHTTSLSHWRTLYAAGKLVAGAPRAVRERHRSDATLVPVTIAPAHSVAERATVRSAPPHRVAVVQLTFSCGTAMRIESAVLDMTMVCALVAQVQR